MAPPGTARDLLYLLVAASPVAAIPAGLRWHRPARTAVWRLLQAGLAACATGDLLTVLSQHLLHRSGTPPPAALCYLTGAGLLSAALLRLGRAGLAGRDVGGGLDAAILAAAIGLLIWTAVISPTAQPTGLSRTGLLLGAAYSAAAALLLALLLRLLTAPGARGRAYWLLLAAAGLAVAGTLAYQILTARAGAALPLTDWGIRLADSALLLGFVTVNAAVLHPSMRQLSDTPSVDGASPAPTLGRLVLLGAAALTVPAVLAGRQLSGAPPDGWAITIGSATISTLVLARMGGLLRQVHAQAAQLARLADTDTLTGALNRRAWQRHLDLELARAARSGSPLALALLDLDNFKTHNDQHGHLAGDQLLAHAAHAWRTRLRNVDTLARLGGDEFSVLLPGCALPAAMAAADDLRRITPNGTTVSIGVACWTGQESAEQLTARADSALYSAKRAGRDRTHTPTPTRRRTASADGLDQPESGSDRGRWGRRPRLPPADLPHHR